MVLHGSPHNDSYTEKLTAAYLEQLESTAYVRHVDLFETRIKPCTDCKYCYKHDGCPLHDSFESIADKLDQADAIILSAPVYYLGFPAPFKAFIDRTQQLFVRRVLFKREKIANNKKGILICTCGGCDLSAVESLKAPAEMFFSVFGATLSETVYLAGTDLPPEKRRCNRIKLIEKEMSK